MILPLAPHFAQNAADFLGGVALRYAAAARFGTLQSKDATRTQDAIVLYSNPSLMGRFGQSPVRPPQFFARFRGPAPCAIFAARHGRGSGAERSINRTMTRVISALSGSVLARWACGTATGAPHLYGAPATTCTWPIARNFQNATDAVSGLFCVGLTDLAQRAGRSFCMPRGALRCRAST